MSDALAAALMATQRRRADPLEQQRQYARMLLQQGASMEPVRTPIQGLTRALTGAVGGAFEGFAEHQEKSKQSKTADKLGRMLAAKSPDEIAAIAKEDGGDMELLGPIMGQMITQKMATQRKAADFNALGPPGGMPAAAPPAGAPAIPAMPGGEGGPVINITPLPNGTPPPGGFNNNVGNLRASPAAWEGKGAPQNGFETFATPQQGVNAAFGNLQAYVKQNPGITVAQAIAKWAPPNENDTELYIRQVAEGTGINPGMPLVEVLKDPAVAAQMLDAITRKEKGGLPQGVTADTFMTATGGQPAAAPLVQTAQAQGSADGRPQSAPVPQQTQLPAMPEISPAAMDLERQAQAAAAGGNMDRAIALRQKAQETQAAYVADRAKVQDQRAYDQAKTAEERAAQAAEHDRREANKPMNKEQSDAAGFADRMTNSFRIIGQNEQEGLSTKGRALDTKVFGVGIPGANYAQSEGYQKFRQAKDDFINAQLRRESGAVISDSEYAAADRQYFPQPGDKPEVVQQKLKNRQLAVEAMTRAAGPNYALNPIVNQPANPQNSTPAQPKTGAVMDGYRFKGGDPSKKENWEVAR